MSVTIDQATGDVLIPQEPKRLTIVEIKDYLATKQQALAENQRLATTANDAITTLTDEIAEYEDYLTQAEAVVVDVIPE